MPRPPLSGEVRGGGRPILGGERRVKRTPGDTPDNPLDEMPPDQDLPARFATSNFTASSEHAAREIARKGFDVADAGDYDLRVRSKQTGKWHRIDPERWSLGEMARDVADVAGGVTNVASQVVGAGLGALGLGAIGTAIAPGPGTAAGVFTGGVAGAGAGAAAEEAARVGLGGKLFGFDPTGSEVGKAALREGLWAAGGQAAAPVVGAAAKGLSRAGGATVGAAGKALRVPLKLYKGMTGEATQEAIRQEGRDLAAKRAGLRQSIDEFRQDILPDEEAIRKTAERLAAEKGSTSVTAKELAEARKLLQERQVGIREEGAAIREGTSKEILDAQVARNAAATQKRAAAEAKRQARDEASRSMKARTAREATVPAEASAEATNAANRAAEKRLAARKLREQASRLADEDESRDVLLAQAQDLMDEADVLAKKVRDTRYRSALYRQGVTERNAQEAAAAAEGLAPPATALGGVRPTAAPSPSAAQALAQQRDLFSAAKARQSEINEWWAQERSRLRAAFNSRPKLISAEVFDAEMDAAAKFAEEEVNKAWQGAFRSAIQAMMREGVSMEDAISRAARAKSEAEAAAAMTGAPAKVAAAAMPADELSTASILKKAQASPRFQAHQQARRDLARDMRDYRTRDRSLAAQRTGAARSETALQGMQAKLAAVKAARVGGIRAVRSDLAAEAAELAAKRAANPPPDVPGFLLGNVRDVARGLDFAGRAVEWLASKGPEQVAVLAGKAPPSVKRQLQKVILASRRGPEAYRKALKAAMANAAVRAFLDSAAAEEDIRAHEGAR